MRKANVIPKAAAAVVCLILTFVLMLPVLSVMSGRMFGGGTMDFNTEKYSEYRNSRPVEGRVHYILDTVEGDSTVFYYLVPIWGNRISNSNQADTLVLVKVKGGTDLHKEFNDVYRVSKDGGYSETGVGLSGALKKYTDDEKKIGETLAAKTPYSELELSQYVIDVTTPISAVTTRFIFGVVAFLATIFCVYLTITAINRNAELEDIEDKRFAFKLEQDRKSGNKNDDGSDKMYGNSDASYGVTPAAGGAAGGYKPSFQSQGGEEFTPRDDTPREIDEDGFLGDGSGSFFGAKGNAPGASSRNAAQGGYSQQGSDPFAGSAFNDFPPQEDNSFYGGSQNSSYGSDTGDDDGFFITKR